MPELKTSIDTQHGKAESERDTKRQQQQKKKRKNRSETKTNGLTVKKRRHSLSKPARDPRDQPSPGISEPESIESKSSSAVVDFDGLSRPICRPGLGTRERKEESPESAAVRMKKIADAVRTIIECIGEDPDREGLRRTPERYAKAMLYFTQGYQENIKDIVNDAIFHEGHNELVIVKDIEVFSLCEHHMVPFTGKMHIGYIPDKDVIGISKLPRIADLFSRRLQIQERLTTDVAHAIMDVVKPQGVAVVMESSHLCMVMRGVQKTQATTITSCVLGCLEKRDKTRNEFFSLVGLNR
ncbi:BgTH12-06349 [Blumeria graminis f. sp. triticale]|uniref:GTP cyclohydrolase 1 n=3 Tax=Blumeria graminis TaxID=34373 RepID=A0A061HDS3_BLUGR|nr:GTP-cyclohydrolase I [Blumeria graminis f. sp. tritici 96224]CAD6500640.1 BgTH12-06349 [Blumeria graminis f. sp. triticale]VCU40916.1 Bgt-1174 [Blumeria graminis f. sp. tritici]